MIPKAMVVLVAGFVVGCASTQPYTRRPAVATYIKTAHGQLEHCLESLTARVPYSDAGDALVKHQNALEIQCGAQAQIELDPLFRDAARTAHNERGTTMYLQRHHERWLAIMRGLGQAKGPLAPDEIRMFAQEIESLGRIEDKLN